MEKFARVLVRFEESLPDYWTPENEAKRQAINEWVRTTRLHDGFIDFDNALRDPDDPERMLPAFDSGDHLHPGDAGYERMGEVAARALRKSNRDDDVKDKDDDDRSGYAQPHTR